MSDALRPSSLFTSAAPATAPSGVLSTVSNPPPEVSQLPAGTTLRGTVVGQDDKGRLLVRTDLGTLAVSTKANLPPGTEVVLQIRSSGAQLHVLLMQADLAAGSGTGGAAQRGLPPGPNPTASTLPPSPGVGAPPPDQLTLGQSIRAILQAPAPLQATNTGPSTPSAGAVGFAGAGALDPAIAAAVARLAPGSQITLRIVAVDAPQGAPAGAPAGATLQATSQAALVAGATSGSPAGPTAGPTAGQGPAALSLVPGQAGATPTAAQPNLTGTSTLTTGTGAQPASPLSGGPALAASVGGPVAPPGSPLGTPPGPPGQAATAPLAPSASTPAPAPPPGQAVLTPLPTSVGAAYTAAQGPLHAGAPVQGGAPLAPQSGPLIPSPATPSLATSGPATAQFTGVVTATTNAGHPVLQTPIGTLTLEVRAPLPVGSRVIFEWTPGTLPRESASLPASLARAWPEIEETVRVLHEAAPSGVTGATTIPQPGVKLASGLLFFLAALSGGDMSRWLGGQAVQTLKAAGRENLLARLGQDFGQLSRHVESGGADWRLFLIPLLDGSQVQQIRFFERHGSRGRGGDQGEGEATRFVLEIELSRLGDMQIDGLVRDKRFDLMLRTRRPLPDVMRHDIIEIFTDANDAAGYVGTIGFQASRDWRFMPINDGVTASAEPGLVI